MVKILIVDDELDFCNSLKDILTKEGYSVSSANSGMEALESVKIDKPHLVLLDIRMPEMDGIRTLKRIKEIDKDIVVMMITVVADMNITQSAIKLGAVNYLAKPLDLDLLKRSLHSWAMQIEEKQLGMVDTLVFEYNEDEFRIALDFFRKKDYNIAYIENKDTQIANGQVSLFIIRADTMGNDVLEVLIRYHESYPAVPKLIAIKPEETDLLNKIREFGSCQYIKESCDAYDIILMARCMITAAEEKKKIQKAQAPSKYVFVVDDDPDICEYISRFLTKEGYNVCSITEGKSVLAQAEALKPSLVLLDIVMPDANGLDLLRKIKQISPQTQVIMITGLKNEAICRESIEYGACNYLVKPFSLDQLKATMLVNDIQAH